MGCKKLTYSNFDTSLKVVYGDFFESKKVRIDYYPFGQIMPNRHGDDNQYRYGFNGMEKLDELHNNSGDSYDFGARILDVRLGRWLSCDGEANKYPFASPYNFVINNPLSFIDPDGNKVKPSKAFLNTDYGRVFKDLRKNNLNFQKTIAKFENNKKFNLNLKVDPAKVKASGALATTGSNPDKSNIDKSAEVNTYFLSSATIPYDSKHKLTKLGIVITVMHEAIHEKIALTKTNDDHTHNQFNTERKNLVKMLNEYNNDNKLGLTVEQITILSYSGQQASTSFNKYITNLAAEKGTTYAEEKKSYDSKLSALVYEKIEKKATESKDTIKDTTNTPKDTPKDTIK